MTIRELIDLLEMEDPDAEVRLMTQPSWPFEWSIEHRLYSPSSENGDGGCDECGGLVVMVDGEHHHLNRPDDEDHEPNTDSWLGTFQPHGDPEAGAVYLCEGRQLGYGTKDAWNA